MRNKELLLRAKALLPGVVHRLSVGRLSQCSHHLLSSFTFERYFEVTPFVHVRTKVAALGSDWQLARRIANTPKPVHSIVEDLAILVDEMATVTAGVEHHEAMTKRETAPTSATNTAHELDFVCPPTTATVDEYEDGTDWESVAIRIDQNPFA